MEEWNEAPLKAGGARAGTGLVRWRTWARAHTSADVRSGERVRPSSCRLKLLSCRHDPCDLKQELCCAKPSVPARP